MDVSPKAGKIWRIARCASWSFCLIFGLILPRAATAAELNAATGLEPLGEQVLQLLQERNPHQFTESVYASANDWASITPSNELSAVPPGFQKGIQRQAKDFERVVQSFLNTAAKLHLTPEQARFRLKSISGTTYNAPFRMGFKTVDSMSGSPNLKAVISVDPKDIDSKDALVSGDYEISFLVAYQYPGGWKISKGILWSKLPDRAGTSKLRQEIALLEKIARHPDVITEQDDSRLIETAKHLVSFLHSNNSDSYSKEMFPSVDEFMVAFERYKDVEPIPPRATVEKMWGTMISGFNETAKQVLDQAKALGLDLQTANIACQSIKAARPYAHDGLDTLNGFTASPVQFVLHIETDGRAKSGQSLSGDYVLTIGRCESWNGKWVAMDKIHWEHFPDGLQNQEEQKATSLANYVAEHRVLPVGTRAPDIKVFEASTGKELSLATMQGKVVLLEFWSISCGPCQEPMAKLQTLYENHPQWKDRVIILTVSIDEQNQQALEHLQKRSWNKTLNAWAGPGEWFSAAAKQFQVSALPTAYVISADGTIKYNSAFRMEDVVRQIDTLVSE